MELSKLMGCVKRPFIPSELFRGGLIDGAWLDPSDLSTLFQDAVGTIPVTAVEQPVGLMLDKSRGMMLGPELVSNGDFSNGATGWTLGAGASVVSGVLQVTSGGNFLEFSSAILSPGKTYVVTFDCIVVSGFDFRIVSSTDLTQRISVTTGFKKLYFKSDGTSFKIQAAGLAFTGSIDNISVKELYGYHATQSITASRPTLSARYNLLTKTEDFADAAWTKLASGTATEPVVTNNYGVAPDGSITAARLQLALNGGTTTTDRSCLLQQPALISGAAHASTFWVKSNTAQSYVLQQRLGLLTQNITIDQTWRAYTYSQIIAADNTHWLALRGAQGTSDSADILIWHPQLIIGATAGPYQRVNTSTDYDTDERYFPKYLQFDGVDDYLNLPYMGLYAGGSASVVINRSKFPAAVVGYSISETSSTADAPVYAFGIGGGAAMTEGALIRNDASSIIMDMRGDSSLVVAAPSFISSFIDDGTSVKRYFNSKAATTSTASRAGTLSLNHTTIGALYRTSVSGFLPDNLYGLIITKSALTDSQRIACERHLSRKSGVQL